MRLGQLKNNLSRMQKIRLTQYGTTIYRGMCEDCNDFDNMTVGLIESDHQDHDCIKINVYQRHRYT